MKKLSLYIILFLLLAQANLYSQKAARQDDYTFQVQKEEGDLNNDKHDDHVIVEMNLKEETRPLRVQIFLSRPDGKLQLAVSSVKLIESQYPVDKKGEHNGNAIPDFIIEEGNLKMLTDINNRKSTYTFRYNKGNFELIHISRVIWDGKNTTSETEINLLTKSKIEFDQELGSDKILNKRKKDLKVNLLPKIQEVSFSDLEQF
ncbi:hypothetical protein PFY12_13640 [Chryseobacterium camelliae]|uniref:DUF4412 domain-containing protein n=1 Tax=Chryseobacterium camelliae TaxID=1265445 RepID=A0ABY7QLP9_9FLAO|nr:hypothetical protein [Chryseobacterium camelliae]WBV60074.1 hypothetical protein PFY12_13640 [Chryseobacterium camelliae]